MRKFLPTLFFTLGLMFMSFTQTPFPWLDDFDSANQPGDKFQLITGQTNTGSHVGNLCFNVSGTYIDDTYYSFESDTLDLSLWTEVEVQFTIASSLRNNDVFAFFWYDSATSAWDGVDLSGLVGSYTISIPTTTILVSVDLNTNANGNVNNKYAHMDRLLMTDPGGTPLPVTLLFFEGHKHDKCNHLDWATASEQNSDHFDIETSVNAYDWTVVGKLPAAGNTNSNIYYNYVVENPLPVFNYYRLVQYDYDGQYEIYGPIAIDNRRSPKKIVKYVNLQGQEITDQSKYEGVAIVIYEDGTSGKIYIKN